MSRRTRPMSRYLGAAREARLMTARLAAQSHETLDNVRVRAHNAHMNTNTDPARRDLTGQDIVDAVRAGTMTKEEVIAILDARMEADRNAPRTISFGTTPPGGWTDADKVSK